MITTIEILAQQTVQLDPTDLVLDPDAPGVVINRTILNTIQITVPSSILVGRVDLSTILLGTAAVQQGKPMLLIRATVTSRNGGFSAGDQITRRGPDNGGGVNIQVVQDLSMQAGQYLGDALEFPIDHLIGFDTTGSGVTGPHRIVLVTKFFEDQDAFAVA